MQKSITGRQKKMKLNPNLALSNFEGTEELKEKGEVITLGKVLINGLLNPVDEPGKKKAEKFELAIRIKMVEESCVEVTAEEVVLLKEVVGYGFTPLVVGQVYRILEGR